MATAITAVVKRCLKKDKKSGKPWCLYTKDGSRLLGAHSSQEKAYKQEAAIKSNASVLATLDEVAEVLEARRAFRLAAEVDDAAGGLADLVDDELEEELNRAGFTDNVLTRDEDVAEKVYKERIPSIDLTPYYEN